MSLLLAGTRTRVRLRTKPALLPRQIEIKEYEEGDTSLQWRLVGATDWIDIIDIADLPEGPQGPQGDPGATGATGPQGPQGDPGPAGSGSGDVIGPASSVNNRVALFDGTTGKLLKDSGVVLGTAAAAATGDFATAAQGTLAGTALQPAAIGVSVQAYAANLTEWATLNPSANAGSLVTAADYAAMRALLDLEAGTDFYSVSAANAAFATAAQGALADTAIQSSLLTTRGDIIYRNATVPARLAKGTPGQVLTMGADDPEWADAAGGGGGPVYIGTLTTTSGSTQSLTDIPSTYKHLIIIIDGVSGTDTHALRVAFSSNNGSSYGSANSMYSSAAAGTLAYGVFTVYRSGVSGANKIAEGGNQSGVGSGLDGFAETSITGVVDAVQFSPSAGTFDAGQIHIYGVP